MSRGLQCRRHWSITRSAGGGGQAGAACVFLPLGRAACLYSPSVVRGDNPRLETTGTQTHTRALESPSFLFSGTRGIRVLVFSRNSACVSHRMYLVLTHLTSTFYNDFATFSHHQAVVLLSPRATRLGDRAFSFCYLKTISGLWSGGGSVRPPSPPTHRSAL